MEQKNCNRCQAEKPRRWVVERIFAWLSKCRGILVRYCERDIDYLGLIQSARAYAGIDHFIASVGANLR